jgi:glutamate decarboxylase
MPSPSDPQRVADTDATPTYGSRVLAGPAPDHRIPDGEMLPRDAYQLTHDELMLDGNARLNLATFVTTWMEPEARALMAETFDKNMIDKDEYPFTAELEARCVHMIADLWHCERPTETMGCSTTGSSEAAMLAGMALKWRWRQRATAAGRTPGRPNLVMGINVQVCWDKFARYWEVEPRLVPLEGDRYHLDPDAAAELCDEDTIGVVGIMGSTFDGSYEPIEALSARLDRLQAESGLDIPIHVDAASGGFVAPFLQPDLRWDFRLPRVASINASGHKYGLVYPGVGWVVWRDADALPDDLVFDVNYLGGKMPTFALNFSRPGSQVVTQYYNLLRLGRQGYTRIHQGSQDVATYLSSAVEALGCFDLLSRGDDIPVFAFALQPGAAVAAKASVFDVSDHLRRYGWLVPAYTMPANRQDLAVLRVVVRNGFSHDMADLLVRDLRETLDHLAASPARQPTAFAPNFAH